MSGTTVDDEATRLSIAQCATLACLLEVNAPKAGNVHRAADFDDATLNDFAASAVVVGSVLDDASEFGVGETVLRCVQATQQICSTNTNLGTVLLLAPLAAVPRGDDLRAGVADVLNSLSPRDCESVYQAIRLANPGGLEEVDAMDVHSAAPPSLLDAMREAASRDLVAAEYVNAFAITFDEAVPAILAGRKEDLTLPNAIVHAQLQLLAAYGDSLIARKCGREVDRQGAAWAKAVLDAGSPHDENYHAALSDFDFWLRSDGRRRNPGTTADLLAAGLFVCLRDEWIAPPFG